MSEENKYFILTKVTPHDVLFDLHPISNVGLTRRIFLNDKKTQQSLPLDWALGIFQDDGLYSMYKQGIFTFNDNDGIVKEAFAHGVYFDDKLDFVPAKPDDSMEILTALKAGNRANIMKMIDEKGKDKIRDIASLNVNDLSQGVVSMLENILNTQLVLDEQ